MPSQVVQTIDEMFPHAAKGIGSNSITASHSPQLRGILNLLKEIPSELFTLPASDYADLVLAISTIETHLEIWTSRGNVGGLANVKGRDAVTLIRNTLAICPDEYPASSTSELSFVGDNELRESIRRDVGAVNRALHNAEWKAATVLAGATIEALLHWKIQGHPNKHEIDTALKAVVDTKRAIKPKTSNPDTWDLALFIEVAAEMKFIESETHTAANLARNFRNLIHPGRATRLNQRCDRGTTYSAVGALEHVIRNLS
jgi:hypothetical protein